MALYIPDNKPFIARWQGPDGRWYQARFVRVRSGPRKGTIGITAPKELMVDSLALARRKRLESGG